MVDGMLTFNKKRVCFIPDIQQFAEISKREDEYLRSACSCICVVQYLIRPMAVCKLYEGYVKSGTGLRPLIQGITNENFMSRLFDFNIFNESRLWKPVQVKSCNSLVPL